MDIGLLLEQLHLELEVERIVGADLGAEAVLERGDDASAVRVILGVGTCDDQHVEWQTQVVAADLDVAFFQHVQQRDLDALD